MYIITGKYKRAKIASPKGFVVRPTSARVRGALFNICQGETEDAVFLDLFAGSGAMGLEALSRGAKKVIFVDKGKESIQCIRKNLETLKVTKEAEVYGLDLFLFLSKAAQSGRKFDLIYADPPYSKSLRPDEKGLGQKVLETIDLLDLLTPLGKLFVEDDEKALQPNHNLATLNFIDARSYGSSALYQYQRKSEL